MTIISYEEVEAATRKLKARKSEEEGEIAAEPIQA
jgi:hypothetical protein